MGNVVLRQQGCRYLTDTLKAFFLDREYTLERGAGRTNGRSSAEWRGPDLQHRGGEELPHWGARDGPKVGERWTGSSILSRIGPWDHFLFQRAEEIYVRCYPPVCATGVRRVMGTC
jgi:hypothetical protein